MSTRPPIVTPPDAPCQVDDLSREDDRPEEHCGVFGVYGRGEDVARITYFGLYALQHRGQESAGIATANGEDIRVHARMGLVAQVFDEPALKSLQGHVAIGHTRYSTTGSSRVCNAQPFLIDGPAGQIALAHNGNLTNTDEVRDDLLGRGHQFDTTSDSEVIGALFTHAPGDDWVERIRRAMPRLVGAYSLVVATPDQLIAVRDPLGVRPLCLGRLNSAWLVSSESCALDTVGAQFIRELEPGEIVCIDDSGVRTVKAMDSLKRAMCVFEFIYFARPDSVIDSQLVYQVRQQMGRRLAQEQPADADIVIAVPDSAVPASIGYAQESGLPYAEGLIKSRYIGRTFIQPDQLIRQAGINLKFNPLTEVLRDKRVVVVDDSIVRGTTTRQIVKLLRRAGAREVHVRIHCPPFVNPCYLGIDVARKSELIAAHHDVAGICEAIGADSLGYLSVEGLLDCLHQAKQKYCRACFTGEYPVPVRVELAAGAAAGA